MAKKKVLEMEELAKVAGGVAVVERMDQGKIAVGVSPVIDLGQTVINDSANNVAAIPGYSMSTETSVDNTNVTMENKHITI